MFLKDDDKDLPYNIGEPYSSAWGCWTHSRGTSKVDGSPVSIFSLTGSNRRLAAARNGVKRLQTVRHPNILSFLYSTEVGSSSKISIYLVTEPVMPLADKIEELGLQGTKRDEYYAWGLHLIAKAVCFLNNDCKLVHGNVCLESVVVAQTLEWKLHGFDVLSEFEGNNEVSAGPILQYDWLVGIQNKPVELTKSDWPSIRHSPSWAIDSWGLGCLIYEIFSGLHLTKTDQLRNTASLPKSLLPVYQRLLCSSPSHRLNSSKLVENCEYFQNDLVDTINFIEILNLKDNDEKDTCFRKLPTLAEQLPREIVLKKLFPLLGSALEFGLAAAPALTGFLKIGAWLSAEEINKNVLPTLVKLFASNDRVIRIGLLQHIDQYGESFPAQVVNEQIATGFSDTSGFLRELTLKSMFVLAPKLSKDTLSGSLFEHLLKLQVDEEPAIRTNTTLLLGNLAGHLYEGTRRRDLIHAFTVRALHDIYPPARGAGIMALSATSSYYDAQDIVDRILPNVVALIIDSDSDVRLKAYEAIEQFSQIVKQFQTSAGDNTVRKSSGMSSLPSNASMLGWATISLSNISEHTSHLPASSSAPNISDVVNASSVSNMKPILTTYVNKNDDEDLQGLTSATSPKVVSESRTVKPSGTASLIDINPIIISHPDSGSPRMEDFFEIKEIIFPESPRRPKFSMRSVSNRNLSDSEDSSCLPTSGRKAPDDDLTKPVKPFSQEKVKEDEDEDKYEFEYENDRFPFATHEEYMKAKMLWDWEPPSGSLSWLNDVVDNGFQSMSPLPMEQNPIIFFHP